MTTIAVADDHIVFRETLIQAIEAAPDIAVEVVYEGDRLEAVLAIDPAPDLVLLDLDLAGRQAQASDVAALLARGGRVLVVSALGSPPTVSAMIRAGVCGSPSGRTPRHCSARCARCWREAPGRHPKWQVFWQTTTAPPVPV